MKWVTMSFQKLSVCYFSFMLDLVASPPAFIHLLPRFNRDLVGWKQSSFWRVGKRRRIVWKSILFVVSSERKEAINVTISTSLIRLIPITYSIFRHWGVVDPDQSMLGKVRSELASVPFFS